MKDSPQYTLSMRMLIEKRGFLHRGGVINLTPCLNGEKGPFCQPCEPGTYKTNFNTDECTPCPCAVIDSPFGATGIDECNCVIEPLFNSSSLINTLLFLFTLCIVMSLLLVGLRIKKRYDEKTVFSNWRFKAIDIPNSFARFYAEGENSPSLPWRFVITDHSIQKLFRSVSLRRFQKEFEQATAWSTFSTYFLPVLKFLNYSPTYLFVAKIIKVSRTNRVITLLEAQDNYDLFVETADKSDKWKLKWAVSSDYSSFIFDIVQANSDKKNTMNWNFTFPQVFKISRFICNLSRW